MHPRLLTMVKNKVGFIITSFDGLQVDYPLIIADSLRIASVVVHPRPLTMLKNKAGFIIASFEGLLIDWPLIIANSLKITIVRVADGKKAWRRLTH